jgi:hypothetical protein
VLAVGWDGGKNALYDGKQTLHISLNKRIANILILLMYHPSNRYTKNRERYLKRNKALAYVVYLVNFCPEIPIIKEEICLSAKSRVYKMEV